MPKFSLWEGHRNYSPRGSISVRTSQSLQHNPLAQQNNSRCTTIRNCSSSNSWSRQSEDKYNKVCLQGQESLSRTKSPFVSHASSHLQLSSNMDAELPVILAAQNLTINPSPSSRIQGYKDTLVQCIAPCHAELWQPHILCQAGTVPGSFWPHQSLVHLNSGGWPGATLTLNEVL